MSPISRPTNVAVSARWKCRMGPCVGRWPVEQPDAVDTHEVLADQRDVVGGLVGVEEVVAEGVDHLQRAVPQPGLGVPRVDQQAAHLDVPSRSGGELRVPASSPSTSRCRRRSPAAAEASARRASTRTSSTRHGLGASARVRSDWWCSVTVQALVIVAAMVGSAGWRESFQSPWPYETRWSPAGRARGRRRGARSRCERTVAAATGPRRRGVPGHPLAEQRGVTGRQEVPADGEDGPVDDVAVRRLHPEVLVPREEAERLGPGPVDVLRREDAKEQGARVGLPVEREQQLERTLRHVPRPPGAARELLEAARGQEVHQASRTSQGRLTASGSASGAAPTRRNRGLRPPVVGSFLHRLGPLLLVGRRRASGPGGVDRDLDVEPGHARSAA